MAATRGCRGCHLLYKSAYFFARHVITDSNCRFDRTAGAFALDSTQMANDKADGAEPATGSKRPYRGGIRLEQKQQTHARCWTQH